MFEILLYYPLTFILWVWHMVFGFGLGEANAASWVLALVFMTFTIRALLFKPFVHQVRSMKKMQDFAPEIKKIQKRYANDRQRQAQAMQKLQREHGFNPMGGCLPILVQVPVFIGLNHVLRAFAIHADRGVGNYMFNPVGTKQYMAADLFGSNLGEAIYNTGFTKATDAVAFHPAAIPVAIPLMVLASVLTHLTARHSVDRQNPAAATQQTAMMNKLTLWIFPIGLLAFGAFLPIGLLIYFLANNAWTLMQQRVVYRKIDKEEEERKVAKIEKRSTLAPRPGQKPAKPGQKPAKAKRPANPSAKQPGPKQPGAKQPGAKEQKGTAPGNPRGDAGASGKQGGKPSGAAANGKDKPGGEAAKGKIDENGARARPDEAATDVPGVVYDATKKKSGRKRR